MMMNWEGVVASLARVPTSAATSDSPPRKKEKVKKSEAAGPSQCGLRLLGIAKGRSIAAPVVLDEVGEGEREPVDHDLESQLLKISGADNPETKLHKLLWNLMANDLRAIVTRRNATMSQGVDLFGFDAPDVDELRLYDVLAWIFSLQRPRDPDLVDGVLVKDTMVTFEETCVHLGKDVELFRQLLARPVRAHMKNMLRAIAEFDLQFALDCERKLEDYVNVSGWRNQ